MVSEKRVPFEQTLFHSTMCCYDAKRSFHHPLFQPGMEPAVDRSGEILEGIIQPRIAVVQDKRNIEFLSNRFADQKIRLRWSRCKNQVEALFSEQHSRCLHRPFHPTNLRVRDEKHVTEELQCLSDPFRRHFHNAFFSKEPVCIQ